MNRLSCFGVVFSNERVVQEAIASRIRSAWKKLKDFSSILCKKGMSLRIKEILYKSYVQNTLSYGAECWAMRGKMIKNEYNRNENVVWQIPIGGRR